MGAQAPQRREMAHVRACPCKRPHHQVCGDLAIITCSVIAVAIIVGVSGFVSLLGEASTVSDLAMAVP